MEKEKCFYCSNEALYNDVVGVSVVGVCKRHLTNYQSA
jgi:hypothetical protein